MTQGTTPTIELRLSDKKIDLEACQKVRAVLMQGEKKMVIDKPDDRMRLFPGAAMLDLTQSDTMFFLPGKVLVQLRWENTDGKVYASTIGSITVVRILEKEEL